MGHPDTFIKMHGLGNDFVIIDSRTTGPRVTDAFAALLGDRHTGVGFDQLAEITKGTDCDINLAFWNSDGSRAGACGNATRCVAGLVMDETSANAISIRTQRGQLFAQLTENGVSVNMGHPQLDWADVPLAQDVDAMALPIEGTPTAVGMGNPHMVFFVDDIGAVDLPVQGSAMEHHPLFPQATNVEFAQARSRNDVRMRVWERGAGITLACGSGACATLVAGVQRDLLDRKVSMEVDGGALHLDWREDGVWMTGPTALVFEAKLAPQFLDLLG